MKKFIKHILLFILPIILGWVLLMQQSLDKKRAFHYLSDDCEGRGAWMYKRIFESQEPIDIAFLGSSHTINGINDTLINQILVQNKIMKKTCNMGYCRLGRDLTYVLMKTLIEEKNTKIFVIEVMADENELSHPMFPFLAESKDILNPVTITNKMYFSNVYNGSVAKWVYLRENVFDLPYKYKYALKAEYGFTTNETYADTNQLNEKKKKREDNLYKSYTWRRKLSTIFPHRWIKKINDLSIANGCVVYFLYLPPFGAPQKQPIEINMYRQYGTVWLLPDSILFNKKNWYDTEHLNLNGANDASRIVAKKMLEVL